MRTTILVFCLSLGYSTMLAQNLVSNPSFEGFTKGRPTASTILVGSPEFCIPSDYSFPRLSTDNRKGTYIYYPTRTPYHPLYTMPKSGEVCVGLAFSPEFNEAIQVELIEELRAGEEYRISLWVKMMPLKKSFPIPFFTAFPREEEDWPAIKNGRVACDYLELWPVDTTVDFCDTVWREVSATYLAKGGESYLALGCLGDANEEIIKKKPYRLTYRGIYRETYYHIDDVLVELIAD